ncbi:Phage integrase, N-terminal SAM-like domain [Salibacterium qingdaonense]|uniref:Phage integrase, N-terminal SAM-like domain n=1 Tax=Salibacterium qingdaonense TaxID=266892 RepID=A0A1I4NKD0_9BACI|nr:Phage integrase, N-terminal SAM-like domain [Salibacterium qingdaonense]
MTLKKIVQEFVQWMKTMERSQETIDGYQKDLMMVGTFLSARYNTQVFVDEINTEDIEAYLTMLKEEKAYQPSSRNRHLHTLRSFFTFCVKKGYLLRSPAAAVEKVPVQQKEREYLNDHEAQQLIQAIDHELIQLVVQVLYYSGLRISECLSLTEDDVNLEKKQLHVRQGKGNKDRYVPLNYHLIPILQSYKNRRDKNSPTAYFFATKKTGKLSPVYVNRVLAETATKL